MTVSNVLNGRTQYVSKATKKRVEREIERLGYRRQANARGLRVAENRSIGMVIIDESPFFLADYFTCQVVAGLANVLNSADYTLTIQGMPGDQLASSMIMRSLDVGGFCAMLSGEASRRQEAVNRLSQLKQPLVVFQEAVDVADRDICVVRQNDYGGGQLIADHLLARRIKTCLVIVPLQPWPAIEYRVDGLRKGLSAGLGVLVDIIASKSESVDDVQAALADYLKDHRLPGAIVGGNDSIAVASLMHLLDIGCGVPDEVLVVGFNGFEAHRYSRPRLTTVHSQPYEMGEVAGRAILERLKSGSFEVAEYLLPVSFQPHLTT